MQLTIFETPVINKFLYAISILYLKIFGWKKEGQIPDIPKFVMIAAPHTSNWDLPITLALAFAFKIKVFWMGKNTIFQPPFGSICRWLGGIPVDRSQSQNLVAQSIEEFTKHESLVLIIPPEGTRKKVRYWKTGFYHIANGAHVPIVLGFVDYGRKAGGIGPVFIPTGDMEADMDKIRTFYDGIRGKNPDQSSLESISVKKST